MILVNFLMKPLQGSAFCIFQGCILTLAASPVDIKVKKYVEAPKGIAATNLTLLSHPLTGAHAEHMPPHASPQHH